MTFSRVLAAGMLAFCLWSPHARAQSTAAAETLFSEGRNAMTAKDYDTACQSFRESNRIDPATGTLLNLAVCETARGHVATAWELFRSVSEKLPSDDPRHDYVMGQLTEIEPRLPKLTLRLAQGAPAETRAREGEVEFAGAAFGIPLPMDPGHHAFTVDAPGFEPTTVEVDLSEAGARELEIAPGMAIVSTTNPGPQDTTSPVATSSPAPARDTGSKKRMIGWIAGGVGAAGVVVGATTGILALGKKSTTNSECSSALHLCSPAGHDAASSGRTLAAVSTVSWVVGALGLGAGAYFIITSNPKHHTDTALSVDFMPGGAGLGVTRTW